MCYSAKIKSDYAKFVRGHGATMDLAAFTKIWLKQNGPDWRKVPKGFVAQMLPHLPEDVRAQLLADQQASETEWQQELFKQTKRKADNERKLQTKVTKAAQEHVRVATNKIDQLKGWIGDLKRTQLEDRDWRIFPQWWAPVIVAEGDRYVVRPMRYQLRKPGLPASADYTKTRQLSGTYNARRDNLERYWRDQFGHTHGLIVADKFYEYVETPEGTQSLRFRPSNREPMFIACIWATWSDPDGKLPDMDCFAAVTDEPEPEVAAAGHDRTPINIKLEHIDAWLNPDPSDLGALYAIFDDKQHPFYEHRIAA